MKNLPLLLGTLVGTFLVVVFVAVAFSKKANTPLDTARLIGDQRLATGSAQPKVTIVEFSDLQCPACKSAEPYVKQVVQSNPEQIRFIYRHFPLPQHKNSTVAALAAETAASVSIEKFWQMHDVMFEKQEEWQDLSNEQAAESFSGYGEKIGIPKELMLQSIKDKTFQDKISADLADGNALGVSSTPSFYVNGQRTELGDLQSVVENLLKQ